MKEYLVSYVFKTLEGFWGHGNIFFTCPLHPSKDDVKEMERQIREKNLCNDVAITNIVKLRMEGKE